MNYLPFLISWYSFMNYTYCVVSFPSFFIHKALSYTSKRVPLFSFHSFVQKHIHSLPHAAPKQTKKECKYSSLADPASPLPAAAPWHLQPPQWASLTIMPTSLVSHHHLSLLSLSISWLSLASVTKHHRWPLCSGHCYQLLLEIAFHPSVPE